MLIIVRLLSGEATTLSCAKQWPISLLRLHAQYRLTKTISSLVYKGRTLRENSRCEELDEEAEVTAVVGVASRIAGSSSAFAALRPGGRVVAWGSADDGGDSSLVKERLQKDVCALFSTQMAFAALLTDGTVVAWGDAEYGGDSTAVHAQLVDIWNIIDAENSFIAISKKGAVIMWGSCMPDKATQLQLEGGVLDVFHSGGQFVALKCDGSAVAWGAAELGLDYAAISRSLSSGVLQVNSTAFGAFAVLKDDSSVVVWGDPEYGGDATSVSQFLLGGVKALAANFRGFAAMDFNGAVVSWGCIGRRRDAGLAAKQIGNTATQLYGLGCSFAVVTSHGGVVAWGDDNYKSISANKDLASGVSHITFSKDQGFPVVVKEDGKLIAWGDEELTESQLFPDPALDIAKLVTNQDFIGVLSKDGTLTLYESAPRRFDPVMGGAAKFHDVVDFAASSVAFAALKADGDVVAWGPGEFGGDTAAVEDELRH